MADKFPEPLSGIVMPRFGEIASFMRLPVERDPKKLDIALVGVPWDGGTTNRPGARHGPREIRNMSTLMRRGHHASPAAPFELCRGGGPGGAPGQPLHLPDPLKGPQAVFSRRHPRGGGPRSPPRGPPP